ncbi:MAG: hypothetical protein V4487_08595 [Chlamydiota bacterium]
MAIYGSYQTEADLRQGEELLQRMLRKKAEKERSLSQISVTPPTIQLPQPTGEHKRLLAEIRERFFKKQIVPTSEEKKAPLKILRPSLVQLTQEEKVSSEAAPRSPSLSAAPPPTVPLSKKEQEAQRIDMEKQAQKLAAEQYRKEKEEENKKIGNTNLQKHNNRRILLDVEEQKACSLQLKEFWSGMSERPSNHFDFFWPYSIGEFCWGAIAGLTCGLVEYIPPQGVLFATVILPCVKYCLFSDDLTGYQKAGKTATAALLTATYVASSFCLCYFPLKDNS